MSVWMEARNRPLLLRERRLNSVWSQASSANPVLIAALLAVGAAAVAGFASWLTGSMALYGDARAHMDVARRVTDGLTPGLAQLGTVWLPLPQMLMAPLVAVDWLWHSGAGAALVSGAGFIYGAVRIFGLAEEWLQSRRAAWCALAIYVTNLNLLYLQTTALTEPLLLAFFIGTAYHLAKWLRTRSYMQLGLAGVFTFCATLTRFDGWVLYLVTAAVVVAWSARHERREHGVQANGVLYAAIGGYGIAMFLLYNLIIFGDPLAWVHSTFSAQAQQRALASVGDLATAHHAGLSLATYGWDVIDVIGGFIVLTGIAGVVSLLLRRGRTLHRNLALLAVLASPIVFNVLALYTGQSTIRVPQVSPHGMWNVRYGAMALPLFALAGAALAQRARWLTSVVLGVAAASLLLALPSTPLTVADGQSGISSAAANGSPDAAAAYLGQHYRGGEALADDASAAPFMYASGLLLRDFVTIGFHPYFEHAMADPADNVRWVVAYPGDAISTDMQQHPGRFRRFRRVLQSGPVTLYERTGS